MPSWHAQTEKEKEEEEAEKFLKELVTSDICFMNKMVYLSVIILKTAICLINICIKEHVKCCGYLVGLSIYLDTLLYTLHVHYGMT
jgi:hypothetical protein